MENIEAHCMLDHIDSRTLQQFVPQAPENRHPLSDARELWRHGTTTCGFCTTLKKNMEKPMRCSRCRRELYCSKECQRKDWPFHKAQCETNSAGEPNNRLTTDHVQSWLTKHTYIIITSLMTCMELHKDPTDAARYILELKVLQRPAQRPEHAFYVLSAERVPYAALGADAEDKEADHARISAEYAARGAVCTLFLVVTVLGPNLLCTMPMPVFPGGVEYHLEHEHAQPERWRERLMAVINVGVII